MEENTNISREKLEKLFSQKKFEEIIALLTAEELERAIDKAELYVWRGNSRYNKKEYDKAITEYDKAIEINPNYELAFYNRGFAWVVKKEYEKAIADYTKVINLNPDYASAYVIRASIRRAMKEYDTANADYDKAIEIDPDYANAYYNRGLAKKENNVDIEGSKQDFEKYLELTTDEDDIWAKYANYYIEYLNERINDKELSDIADLISKIKCLLLIKDDCITHYTSLSVLKKLILEEGKFRISEGNFMNDPSEGKDFFNFLKYERIASRINDSFVESFSPKPFIGSFVTKDNHNDLNMWRFYGKEENVEAKGCAITLRIQEFIEDVNNFLSNEVKEARIESESDINFYRVIYLTNGSTTSNIPISTKNKELEDLMTELKEKVTKYQAERKDKTSLEKYLNSIAFLFKSDAYKNENEVRLVVKGIEFEKKYNIDATPPRVYIELAPIKNIVEKITLGPKVDKINEWVSAFHYSYKGNAPAIEISHLPYK